MNEIWKDIPGYEGRYQASNEGRIRSIERWVAIGYGSQRLVKARILKACALSCHRRKVGNKPQVYRKVALGRGSGTDYRRRTWPIHQLVALTFLGPPPPHKPYVLHRHGSEAGDALSNLYYGSQKQNGEDSRFQRIPPTPGLLSLLAWG